MSFTDWPGVGDVPEPEDEGLRDELIEKEKERREQEREDMKTRGDELKDFYSGKKARDEGSAPAPAPKPAPAPAKP